MTPFVDLRAQYHSIKDEIDAAILRVLESSQFVLGDEVVAFEDAAQAHGAEYKGRRVGSIGNLGCFSFYSLGVPVWRLSFAAVRKGINVQAG